MQEPAEQNKTPSYGPNVSEKRVETALQQDPYSVNRSLRRSSLADSLRRETNYIFKNRASYKPTNISTIMATKTY